MFCCAVVNPATFLIQLKKMSYTVLARKYRSQTFDDIVGQGPISQTLKNAIKIKRVAHAFLFVGTRGVGKTTMARILAKALNCHAFGEPTTKPCCKCDSCIAVNSGDDIDVVEIDGASNNGVEQVRQLRENAIYRPARSRFKIYIIDEVHMLSVPAFNALLKILEEPPSHVKFIFATTEPNKVIPTIQSRCQRFDFNNISPKEIALHLAVVLGLEKIKFDQDLVLHLAKMANGSMRDGLSLLDRLISTGAEPLSVELLEEFLGCPNSEKISNLISQIGDSDPAGTLAAAEELVNAGLSEVQIADALIDHMRDLMIAKSAGPETDLLVMTADQRKNAISLAEKFDIAGLIYNITALEKLRWTIKNSDTARALLEASLLRFALSEHFLNVDFLLGQMQNPSTAKPKKKQTQIAKPASQPEQSSDATAEILIQAELASIKNNWQNILTTISEKLSNGTAGLLAGAEPTEFTDGTLTLTFPSSAEMSKKMCESNGRADAIESLLAEILKQTVRLKFQIAPEEKPNNQSGADQVETTSQKRNKIVSDPAVKTLIMGLGATITGIEEKTEKN